VTPNEANQYSADEEANHESNMQSSHDKDLFDEDITQSSKDINNFTSPLFMIDT
jgi:hypothetical protein